MACNGLSPPSKGLRDMDRTGAFRAATALCLGAVILVVNTVTPLHDAVAVLYVLVVLVIADACGSRTILMTGAICAGLSIASFVIKHHGEAFGGADIRLAVSLVAIGVATTMSRRARLARAALSEQATWLAITHDTVIIRDHNGVILDWNEGAARLYGWTRADAIGQRERALLQTDYRAGGDPPSLLPGERWSGEITRIRRDGRPIVLSSRWLGRVDEDGRSAGIIEISADLTEQRRAQQARARSEKRYAAIFAGAGVAIFEVVADDYATIFIREANGAAARLLDAGDVATLAGMDLAGHLSLDDRVALSQARLRVSAGGETVELPAHLCTCNDDWRDVILTLSAGAEAGVLLITALDVTERTRALQRIERMQTDLAHAARISALGQMTATIAHEINQPLQAAVTFARSGQRWLARTPADLGEVAHCLDRIVRTGERAGEVIARVRAMSRNEPPMMTVLDPGDLVQEALEMLSGELRRNVIRVRTDIALGHAAIMADRVQMQQVLVNVMLNAVQAMTAAPDRELALTLQTRGDDGIVLIIDDTGPGFDPDTRAQMFAPFISARPGGVGIGLSLSRSIMVAHGGQIAIDNRDGGGARVSLVWPRS